MERYSSGTSLERTKKEEWIDSLERALWAEFSDEAYCELKKLSIATLKKIHEFVAQRISGAYEHAQRKRNKP